MSLNIQSKLINKLNETFTEKEQQWYITNLYIYMHYHPINDFVVNLENVYKMIGYANKANAKRTLKNNFIENEDYKILLIRTDEQIKNTVIRKDDGKFGEETIMLNIDTFKSICMFAKTDKGSELLRVLFIEIYNSLLL
jgi:phage anti-repressor protein